jgi:alkylation response protein AidB-like acyl-CoA dehydrogenase
VSLSATDPIAERPIETGSDAFANLLDVLREGAKTRERDRILPHQQIEQVRNSRLGAWRVPAGLGGGGISVRDLIAATIEIGAADPNVAHILRNHFVFVDIILRSKASAGRQRWLNKITSGQIFGLAFTDSAPIMAGTSQTLTTLSASDGALRLNGIKAYSTGSLFADWIRVSAVLDDGEAVFAIIPADREGVTLVDDWDGIGQRLTGSGTTILKDVAVATEEIITRSQQEGIGYPYQGALSQLFLTAVIAGILKEVVRDGSALLGKRGRNFVHATADKPAEDPLLQQTLGEISSAAYAAEAILLRAADALDRAEATVVDGAPAPEAAHQASLEAAKAKIIVDRLALQGATALFDLGGASAVTQHAALDRHWRNIRTIASHNPSQYKARAIGDLEANGRPLPATSFF